ncbi:MAG: GNAT family N-acetyltransferase [Peptococcaceae bacterium]|nr:GNAT family N-acetyltransferase [Peptococcaceae bacterium]
MGRTQFHCEKGPIVIEGPVTGEYVSGLEFDERLNNFRVARKQKDCLCEIADSPDGLLYIARHFNTIIGYVTFHDPDPLTRWVKHPKILELGAVEVSPSWRGQKIARHMLRLAFANPLMRERIVITMEYCWHWDLEGCGMNLWNYQKMLTSLFGSAGLMKVSTNDPEITEHPANVLMARIGEDVSQEMIDLFDMIRFESESC